MARTRAFAKNAGANAVYQAILLLSGFVIPRIILKHYGSEANGLVGSIGQFITCFNLVEAGLSGAGVLALYKPLADDDRDAVSGILSATRRLYLQVGGVFSLLVLALAALYPWLKETAALTPGGVAVLVCALGARSFFEFFAVSKHRVFLLASQQVWVVSLCTAVTQMVNLGVIALAASLNASLWLVYVLAILPIVLRSLLIALYVRRTAGWVRFDAPPRFDGLKKRWDVLVLQVLGVVQTGSPVIMATLFLSLADVSVFTVHGLVITGIGAILSVFTSGLSASFGDVIARKEREALQRAVREFEAGYYALVAFSFSVAAVLVTQFVDIYVTGIRDADYHRPLFAFLLVLNGLLNTLKTPQGLLVISAGLYRETRVQSAVQAAIIVALGCLLTPSLGLPGLVLAMIASNVYRVLDLMFFIPKNVTGLPVAETAARMGLCILTAALVFVPCHLMGVRAGTPGQLVTAAVAVSAYAAAVTACVNFLFQRRLMGSICRRVGNLLRRAVR